MSLESIQVDSLNSKNIIHLVSIANILIQEKDKDKCFLKLKQMEGVYL
jgi:hypothetical protein